MAVSPSEEVYLAGMEGPAVLDDRIIHSATLANTTTFGLFVSTDPLLFGMASDQKNPSIGVQGENILEISTLLGLNQIGFKRYLPSGAVDVTFRSAGMFAENPSDLGLPKIWGATRLLVLADQSFIVAGYLNEGASFYLGIAKYQAGGTLSWFKSIALTFAGTAIPPAVGEYDGGIVVAFGDGIPPSMTLVRYFLDGTRDTAFGVLGSVTLTFGNTLPSLPGAMAVSESGLIAVGGFAGPLATAQLALARLLPNGTLDSDFQSGGIYLDPNSSATRTYSAVAFSTPGRILAAGVAPVGTGIIHSIPNTGQPEMLLTPLGTSSVTLLHSLPDGRFLAAGRAAGTWHFGRFNP